MCDDRDSCAGSKMWPRHCSMGDAEIQKEFPLLAKLRIPLGTTEADVNARSSVLQSLLALDESMGTKKHKLSTNFNQVHYVLKIPRIQANTKPDVAVRTLKRRQFFEILFECMHENRDIDKTAALFCTYLAKNHNAAFVEAIPVAQALEKKSRKIHNSSSSREEVIMYDGGSRKNSLHVTWNQHYQDLLVYHQRHGHCSLPCWGTNGLSEHDRELSSFLAWQRRQYRDKAPSLTPKRIQLLEAIGVTWTVKPRVDCATDPKFHKALAAKIFFDPTLLTARDAMTMSGYEEEVARATTRKNHLNQTAANFYKKEFKHSAAVREILKTLGKMLRPDANADAIMEEVYGSSTLLSRLKREGKLEPRKAQQWLQQQLPKEAMHRMDRSAVSDTVDERRQALPDCHDEKEPSREDLPTAAESKKRKGPPAPFIKEGQQVATELVETDSPVKAGQQVATELVAKDSPPKP